MTVLLTPRNRIATKRWIKDSTGKPELINFDLVKMFSGYELAVSDIYELSAKLTMLETIPQALVIRGAPLSHIDLKSRHQRLLTNFQTPSAGRRWLLLDLDKIKVPVKLTAKGKEADLRAFLVNLLPAEFHDTTYHWQLSSKAGMVKSKAVSMHLWFWLEQPVPDAELKVWAVWVKQRVGFKLIDPALFNAVQPHYTAAPVFEGVKDPVKKRSGLHRGTRDDVQLVLPPPGTSPPAGTDGGGKHKQLVVTFRASSGVVGFEAHLASIGDHVGGTGFHHAILRATASYVASHVMDESEVETLYQLVSSRVHSADRSAHDDDHIETKASREVIIPMIQSAIKKFSAASPNARGPRLRAGVPPYYPAPTMTVEEASTRMRMLISDFFKH